MDPPKSTVVELEAPETKVEIEPTAEPSSPKSLVEEASDGAGGKKKQAKKSRFGKKQNQGEKKKQSSPKISPKEFFLNSWELLKIVGLEWILILLGCFFGAISGAIPLM